MMRHMNHIVSVSGGKDSTATYCRAVERGLPFRAVFADTGNEHPATYEAVRQLSRYTGGPEVEWVKADFTDKILRKRTFIEANWEGRGVPRDLVDRALAILHPSGNPYLDMCLWKGRFPSRRAQFCTQELKVIPINQQVVRPLLRDGKAIVSWQGVRRAESIARRYLDRFNRLNEETIFGGKCAGRFYVYRPLIHIASVEEVFAIADRHGIPRNPLYGWGCSRVGCFPCINASKSEIALLDKYFPEQIERLEEWERLVSEASKRGKSSFFCAVNDPVMYGEIAYEVALNGGMPPSEFYSRGDYGIRRMVEWAKTDRGGRQYLLIPKESVSCATEGVCE